MYLKRASFRRGGSSGLGQLTPNRQMYAGGGNIGGGTIAGTNLGTRTGFESIILQSSGLPYPDSKPKYVNPFKIKGYPNRAGILEALKPKGLAKYPLSAQAGLYSLAFAPTTALAYLNRAKTDKGLEYMKSYPKGYLDETAMEGEMEEFDRGFAEANKQGKKISFADNFKIDLKKAPEFILKAIGTEESRKELKKREVLKEIKNQGIGDDKFAEARESITDTPNYKAVDFDEIVDTVVTDKKTDTDDDTPKEPSFEDTYEKEKSRIEKLLGDDDQKGFAAIALSDAIGTPGTIADKAAVLNKSLLGIMQGKRKDRKDIAKLAYTATKEIEKAKIAAGKEGFSERNYKRLTQLQKIIGDTTGTYSEAEKKSAAAEYAIAEKVISSVGGKKDKTGLTTGDIKVLGNIDALVKEIKRHEGKNDDKYKAALAKFARAKAALQGFSQFNSAIAIAEAEIGGTLFKKDGGRIKKQLGGGTETTAMEVSETVGQGETPTAQVQQLSFSELRNRLPKEITDDVIRLLSNSNEALQDFAYIRTQGDVSKFNTKYGVTLVLPAQTA